MASQPLERGLERTFAGQEKPRVRMTIDDQTRGLDQILVALRVVKPRDRADRKLVGADAERRPRLSHGLWRTQGPELLHGSSQIDDANLVGPHESRVAHEVATFWNHGVSVRFACSCRIVGSRRIAPAMRPNVVAP